MTSILIVNYKTENELDSCIESIYKTCQGSKFEILVLGNDLIKSTKTRVLKKYNSIKYVIPSKNLGYGAGNNYLFKKAIGDYLLVLNPDTILKNNIVKELSEFLSKNKKIGCVSPLVLKDDQKPFIPQASKILNPISAIFSISIINKVFPNNPIAVNHWLLKEKFTNPTKVGVINGACFMIKKETYEKIGGFDEKFFLYFEDTDLCKRITDLGFVNFVDPAAKIIHHLGSSTKKNLSTNEYVKKSRFHYLKKHYGVAVALITELFLRISKYSLLLGLIVLLGGFFRLYNLSSLMVFIGDQGWFYWSAKQLVVDNQIPLVGIASSHAWIHQGALWTYILAVIFGLFNFNPFAPVYFTALLGTFTIFLIYFVSKKMFSKQIGLLSAFIFATSPLVIHDSRLAYHTSPIPTVTILFIYSVYKWIKGDNRFFVVSMILIGILYNLEIATFSLIATFGLIFLFGLIRKKKWVLSLINNKKTIYYSIIGFLIPMTPMFLYDLGHGFPQTLKFIVWVFYRIAVFFGYPPLHGSAGGETWSTFANYNLEIIRHLIFLPNAVFSLAIIIITLCIFLFSNYKSWFKRKFIVEEVVMFTFIIIPTLGFLSQKTNSGAYLLMLFPQWIILIAYSINKLMTNRIRTIIFGTSLMFLGLMNVYILFKENYFTHRSINDQLETAKTIIKESKGEEFNILGKGVNSEYESFITPYKYLLWYLEHPASEKNEKLKFYVTELPDKIKIEVEN